MIEKFKNTIIGAAVGDAIGILTEKTASKESSLFVKTFRNNKTYSIQNRTYPEVFLFGQYSDDTQFSRTLIESLLDTKEFDPKDYLQRLLDLFSKNKIVGIGGNTSRLFSAYLKNLPVDQLTKLTSNGSLMRAYPIGLLYEDEKEILLQSKRQSEITHNTDEAIHSCQMLALTINFLKTNSSESVLEYWKTINLLNFDFSFLNLSLEKAQEFIFNISPNKEWEFVTPSAKATLAASLYAFYNNRNTSFEEAILTSIELGGDTDSVASVTGALMGICGAEIPVHWRNIVHDRSDHQEAYLSLLGEKLYNRSLKKD